MIFLMVATSCSILKDVFCMNLLMGYITILWHYAWGPRYNRKFSVTEVVQKHSVLGDVINGWSHRGNYYSCIIFWIIYLLKITFLHLTKLFFNVMPLAVRTKPRSNPSITKTNPKTNKVHNKIVPLARIWTQVL